MAPIRVSTPRPSSNQGYPIAILRGNLTTKGDTIYIAARRPALNPVVAYPVRNRHFTALYDLQPGVNHIRLSLTPDLADPVVHTVTYTPPPTAGPFVRLVYLLAADTDGSFQSDAAGAANATDAAARASLASGVQRVRTAGRLIQAATADMLNAQGLGARTFSLAPDVLVHRLRLPAAQLLEMDGMALWHAVGAELDEPRRRRADCINVAIMSFSRMTASGVKAHTALGGGTLALFGGASLFTWPEGLGDVPAALMDRKPIDDKCFFDDSAGRARLQGRCAIAATTIGALLHELGHCLSLPHPCGGAARDGGGIMARGFDHIDRLFLQPETGQPRAFWDRGSAVRLRHHAHILAVDDGIESRGASPEQIAPAATPGPTPSGMSSLVRAVVRELIPRPSPSPAEKKPPRIERGPDGCIRCRSDIGIGHVGFYKNGDNAAHAEFPDHGEGEYSVPSLDDLRRLCEASESDKLKISVIDVEGRITEVEYDSV